MGEIRSIYTHKGKNADKKRQPYVEGAAVRKLRVEEIPARNRRKASEQHPRVYRVPKEQAKHFSMGYTLFLAAASALALWVCAGYLQIQADNTARIKNIAALEEQLAEVKTENDDEYNRVTTSVDLEEIRDMAMNELGMVYASADQVILYDSEGSDYVKQYGEIPGGDSSLTGLLGTISR